MKALMDTSVKKTVDFTVTIPQIDLKRFKGLIKAMGWSCKKKEPEYYESEQFYRDVDKAEADIAAGKSVSVSNADELDKLLA